LEEHRQLESLDELKRLLANAALRVSLTQRRFVRRRLLHAEERTTHMKREHRILAGAAAAVVGCGLLAAHMRGPAPEETHAMQIALPAPEPMPGSPTAPSKLPRKTPALDAQRAAPQASSSYADLTLAALSLTREQQETLYAAEERFVAGCMREHGFSYKENAFDGDAEDNLDFERLEPGDVEAAEAVGYGLALIAERGRNAHIADANAAYVDRLSPAEQTRYREALLGRVPDATGERDDLAVIETSDGAVIRWDPAACVAKAREQLYGGDVAMQKARLTLSALRDGMLDAVAGEEAVAEALANWRTCMQAAGQPFASPDAIPDLLAKEQRRHALTVEDLSTRERELAPLDMRCRRSSGLLTARAERMRSLEAALEQQHQGLLREIHDRNTSALRRAQRALGLLSQR
jgi:hypothetical protein